MVIQNKEVALVSPTAPNLLAESEGLICSIPPEDRWSYKMEPAERRNEYDVPRHIIFDDVDRCMSFYTDPAEMEGVRARNFLLMPHLKMIVEALGRPLTLKELHGLVQQDGVRCTCTYSEKSGIPVRWVIVDRQFLRAVREEKTLDVPKRFAGCFVNGEYCFGTPFRFIPSSPNVDRIAINRQYPLGRYMFKRNRIRYGTPDPNGESANS